MEFIWLQRVVGFIFLKLIFRNWIYRIKNS
ncbi:hypothetical protein C5167_035571 [Papaver somniferum]|uniref:Uncharacterized protein n=1 Tax=Papaver somniferum TaxID=3469 RepID=A0A4Y7KHN5_PAPSO|nr:hypothetical protein C5167_035571 [Papaver somniferum]